MKKFTARVRTVARRPRSRRLRDAGLSRPEVRRLIAGRTDAAISGAWIQYAHDTKELFSKTSLSIAELGKAQELLTSKVEAAGVYLSDDETRALCRAVFVTDSASSSVE